MITYLSGAISDLTPTSMVVECAGVGYLVNISLTTYTAYQGFKAGKVLITQIIREDAHLLYGFATAGERELFALLTSVSGIGPNTARVILSSYAPHELNTIIALGQVEALKAVKGIGLKTAQRIILELKGKIVLDEGEGASGLALAVQDSSHSVVKEEAVSALKMLGYPEPAALKVVGKLLADSPVLTVEQVIKQSLKLL
ncbi:MAG: Holliday junction branch migration protein RuvA [Porphyromonadaceae bacterium]|nr:Holliday junction branch migration protein RuvA [Porphyromonadaceae bacterium]